MLACGAYVGSEQSLNFRVRHLRITFGQDKNAWKTRRLEFEALVALQDGIVNGQGSRAIIAYEKDGASTFVRCAIGDARAAD